jgi:hypothetical protein
VISYRVSSSYGSNRKEHEMCTLLHEMLDKLELFSFKQNARSEGKHSTLKCNFMGLWLSNTLIKHSRYASSPPPIQHTKHFNQRTAKESTFMALNAWIVINRLQMKVSYIFTTLRMCWNAQIKFFYYLFPWWASISRETPTLCTNFSD